MKFSVKLLLLFVTLAAVLIAYARHQYDYLRSQGINRGNAEGLDGILGLGFTATDQIAIVEADTQRSLFYFGADGDLVAVTLAGPAGRSHLSVLSKDLDAIDNLTFASHEAIDTFIPGELPRIKRVVLKDLDWDAVDLTSLGELKHLEKLYLDTAFSDPRQVLWTIPSDATIERIEIVASRQLDLSGIKVPGSLKTLTISCPDLDADAIRKLQLQLPECSVIGYDNAKSKEVPSG